MPPGSCTSLRFHQQQSQSWSGICGGCDYARAEDDRPLARELDEEACPAPTCRSLAPSLIVRGPLVPS